MNFIYWDIYIFIFIFFCVYKGSFNIDPYVRYVLAYVCIAHETLWDVGMSENVEEKAKS